MKKALPAVCGWAVLIAGACLLLFGRGLRYGFLRGWDDDAYVEANTHLQWTLENFFYWWYTPLEGLLTPLTANSLMLDALLWGQDCPAGFRLTNILLHLLTAWLFFFIGRKNRVPAGWMCGIVLCWALHVQRLESVLWIAERKDVLSGFLALAAWGFMLWSRRPRGILAAGICGMLAVFAKPAMAGTAVLILAAAWGFREKGNLRYWRLPAAAAILTALAVLPAFCMASGGGIPQDEMSRKILVIGHNFCWYIYNTVLPLNSCTVYPRVEHVTGALAGGGAVLCLLLAAGSAVYGSVRQWFCRYWPWMLVWGAFFAPSCGWRVFSNTDYADRYNYLPSLIFFYCLALMGRDAMAHSRSRVKPLTAAVLLLAVLFGVRAWMQVPVWQSAETVFLQAVTAFPRPNPKAVEGLGREGMLRGRSDLLKLAGERFLFLAANPSSRQQKGADGLAQNMGAFYTGLAAYYERRYADASQWWRPLAEAGHLPMYYGDLYLPVLYGGYADICLRAGENSRAEAALIKQKDQLQKHGPAWYRADGLLRLLSGDEPGALASLEAALAGMKEPDQQLQRLVEAVRKRVKKTPAH